jgi:hypothetical protein
MLAFAPSVRAATACLLAVKLFSTQSWTPTLRYFSGNLGPDDILDCERATRRLLEAEQDGATTNKLTAVKRKYASSRFSEISLQAMELDLNSYDLGSPSGLRAIYETMDICHEVLAD